MTLIIGFRCKDGVALVSDTKIVDVESNESLFGSKILIPLIGASFIVAAAGYSDLFREFNRKIPSLVNQRSSEVKISNIEALIRAGYKREEAIDYLKQFERPVEQHQQSMEATRRIAEPQITSTIPSILPPYVYSYEFFMDDCKQLIKTISSQWKDRSSNPLDVLIGVKKDVNVQPSLHYIDCDGHEREIEKYYAIGTGSPHVKQFFEPLYSFNKDMCDLITIAFLAIAYTQDVAKDAYVGYDSEHPPEAFAVFDDGRCGKMPFENEAEVLTSVKARARQFEELIKDTNIEKLRPRVEMPSLTIHVPRLVGEE
jgi:20S proteasome alpha/beta subunit